MYTKPLGLALALLLSACAVQFPRPTETPANQASNKKGASTALPSADVEALFARELETLPALAVVSGKGWSTKVPGSKAQVKADPADNTEEIQFSFEPSGSVDCVVHADVIDPASYIGNIVDALKKSLEVVRIVPKRFAVEQEFPVYFLSIVYHKQTEAGVLAGELKLGLAVHDSRPIVCMHDVPGYSETFEKAVRAVFANYRVEGDVAPTARVVSSVSVGSLPIGFSQESVRVLPDGQTEFRSISTQIVPRSPTEVMVSDKGSLTVASKSRIERSQFIDSDSKGVKLDIQLARTTGGKYKIAGKLGNKPFESTFDTKNGLSDPDALALQLKNELKKNKPFRFTRAEYQPSVDPMKPVEVSYAHEQKDPAGVVHMALGQTEAVVFVDENGEPVKMEIEAGSNTIVFERHFCRDDRSKSAGASGKKQ